MNNELAPIRTCNTDTLQLIKILSASFTTIDRYYGIDLLAPETG